MAELPNDSSFGSSAVFCKTRCFPPPPYEGFGLIGRALFAYLLSQVRLPVNLKLQTTDCLYPLSLRPGCEISGLGKYALVRISATNPERDQRALSH